MDGMDLSIRKTIVEEPEGAAVKGEERKNAERRSCSGS